jgi:hypothetical protein
MYGRRKGGAPSSSRLGKDLEEFRRKVDRRNSRDQRRGNRRITDAVTLSTAAVWAMSPVGSIAPRSVK